MGRVWEQVQLRLGKLGFAGVGAMLIAIAYNIAIEFYPLTNYNFISQNVARGIFWFLVALGVFGIVCIVVSLFRSRGFEDENTKKLEEIRADLATMSEYEHEVAMNKSKQRCPDAIAQHIHDDFFAYFNPAMLGEIFCEVLEGNIDPLLDFSRKFGDILDANGYGLKSELENIEPYKSTRLDLAQKRSNLHTSQKKNTIIQKNIDRLRSLTYGLNSSIVLREILRSIPQTTQPVRSVLVVLEKTERIVERHLANGLKDIENEWKMDFDLEEFMNQLGVLFQTPSHVQGFDK